MPGDVLPLQCWDGAGAYPNPAVCRSFLELDPAVCCSRIRGSIIYHGRPLVPTRTKCRSHRTLEQQGQERISFATHQQARNTRPSFFWPGCCGLHAYRSYWIVRTTVVAWLKVPLVPVMVSVRFPVAALRPTLTVRVDVPEPVTEVGLKLAV